MAASLFGWSFHSTNGCPRKLCECRGHLEEESPQVWLVWPSGSPEEAQAVSSACARQLCYLCVCRFGSVYLCLAAQSRATLRNPLDCSPPGYSGHGIFQARILEWVAISSSRGSSWPRDPTHVSYFFCIGRWVLYHYTTWEATVFHSRTRLFLNWCSP